MLASQCDHRKANRKSALYQLNGTDWKCSICDTVVKMVAYTPEELNKSVQMIHQAVQHIKINDAAMNESVLKDLGQFTLVLNDIPGIYKRATKDNAYKANKFQKQSFNGGQNANMMAALFGGNAGNQFGYANPKKSGNWGGHR